MFVQIASQVNELFYKSKVTQTFNNPLEDPLELKILVFKKDNIIFSSFECQIGDSIKVKSKIIKEEKAKEKYGIVSPLEKQQYSLLMFLKIKIK